MRIKILNAFVITIVFCFSSLFLSGSNLRLNKLPMKIIIDEAITHACNQSLILAEKTIKTTNQFPKSLKNGQLEMSTSDWWCSGFFPGTLWYLYEDSGNKEIGQYASIITNRLYSQQYNKDTHDLGFMLYCSYGNAYRLTKKDSCESVLINGAKSLSTRYNSIIGCIQSWNGDKKWTYPVIIDNMMNLEYLMWAYNETKDDKFKNIAISHANVTLKNHFRSDYSCYHVVSYSVQTGQVESKTTHQGFNNESAWARGQAWALYGYEMMYRETKNKAYLNQAIHIAAYILNNKNLPADKIPFWDFNAPDIPNALRDASAAAIISSALIELSQYVDKKTKVQYLDVAENQIRTLASPQYTAEIGTNSGFILKHSVGFFRENSEVDAPLSYADYYYIEALLRYKKYVLKK